MKDRPLFILNCSLMVQHSIILLILGPMVPEIMQTFKISEGTVGLLLGAGSLGSVLGPLIAGFSIDRAGMKTVIPAGLAAEAVLLILFGLSPFFWSAVICNFFLVLFSGPSETSVNIIPAMIKSSNPGRIMNLVHLSFSIGAFYNPPLNRYSALIRRVLAKYSFFGSLSCRFARACIRIVFIPLRKKRKRGYMKTGNTHSAYQKQRDVMEKITGHFFFPEESRTHIRDNDSLSLCGRAAWFFSLERALSRG